MESSETAEETAESPSPAASAQPVLSAEPAVVQAPAVEEERLPSLPTPPVRRRARTRVTARLVPAATPITAAQQSREAPSSLATAEEQQTSMRARRRRPTPEVEVLSASSEQRRPSPLPAAKPVSRATVRRRVGPPSEPSRRRVPPVAPAAAVEPRQGLASRERMPIPEEERPVVLLPEAEHPPQGRFAKPIAPFLGRGQPRRTEAEELAVARRGGLPYVLFPSLGYGLAVPRKLPPPPFSSGYASAQTNREYNREELLEMWKFRRGGLSRHEELLIAQYAIEERRYFQRRAGVEPSEEEEEEPEEGELGEA